MNEYLSECCLKHIIEAEKLLNSLYPIGAYEEIFEATDPKTAVRLKENETKKQGIGEHLKAAAQGILKIIHNIIESISDFFKKRNMSQEERKAYEKFKEACKKDPSLKDKKITVVDYNKFTAEYNKILQEAEKADKELAAGKEYPTEELIKKITNFCGNGVKNATVVVGTEVALQFASSSTEAAQEMLNALHKDERIQKEIIDAIGKKEAKKFEKQMSALTKRSGLRRKIMELKGYRSRSLQDAIDNTISKIDNIITGGMKVSSAVSTNPEKNQKPGIGTTIKTAFTNRKDLKAGLSQVTKGNSDLIRRSSKVKEFRQAASTIMDLSSKGNKTAREIYKNEKRKEKMAKRMAKQEPTVQDQSMINSITRNTVPEK